MIFKLRPDEIAAIRQPLTIDDVPIGRFFPKGSNAYLITWLPEMSGEYASPICAYVISVGPLYSFRTRAFYMCEGYHDDNR